MNEVESLLRIIYISLQMQKKISHNVVSIFIFRLLQGLTNSCSNPHIFHVLIHTYFSIPFLLFHLLLLILTIFEHLHSFCEDIHFYSLRYLRVRLQGHMVSMSLTSHLTLVLWSICVKLPI